MSQIVFGGDQAYVRTEGGTEGLRPQEATLLIALMGRPVATYDDLAEILWPHPDTMPDWWLTQIHVIAHRVRAKIGGGVRCVRTRGYALV